MNNLRPGEAFRWKVETVVGKVNEWYVVSRNLQGYNPRLCQLKTDGLGPVSKY
jgi:hypothetical protein